MPKSNSSFNIAIANFLIAKGFKSENSLKGKQRGIDMKAKKESIVQGIKGFNKMN